MVLSPQRSTANHELARIMAQDFHPARRDDEIVLDAQAADSGQIDPGLDGNDHALFQGHVVAGDDVRALEVLQTDAVAAVDDQGAAASGNNRLLKRVGDRACSYSRTGDAFRSS